MGTVVLAGCCGVVNGSFLAVGSLASSGISPGPPDAVALHAYEQALIEALGPWSTGRRYLNFMFAADATPQTTALAYSPESYERLVEI